MPASSAHLKATHKPSRAASHKAALPARRSRRKIAAKVSAAVNPYVVAAAKPVLPRKAPDPTSAEETAPKAAGDRSTPIPDQPTLTSSSRASRIAKLSVPPPLVGSHASLVRQNDKVESDGLERIEDSDDLKDRIARKMLVPLPASSRLTVSDNLPEELRYCRPWTATFLTDLARAYAALYHRPLIVSSAVRTVEYQKQLMLTNGNAAAAEGDVVSPHLTGATIDISKQGMSSRELGWLRRALLAQQTAGKIDVEEEFRQVCFHITVYKSYAPPKPQRKLPPTKAGQVKPIPPRQAQPKPALPLETLPPSGRAAEGI